MNKNSDIPAQQQGKQPGVQSSMTPSPQGEMRGYLPAGKLAGKVALISGGDSGIGRATAIGFAKEGADVAFLYCDETEDAEKTRTLVEAEGRRCISIAGDIGDEAFCRKAVDEVIDQFQRIDILVNNAAEQHTQEKFEDITAEQLTRTFRTNIFGYFFLTKAALPHMPKGASIINTASVLAYRGSPILMDYAATKGAVVSLTRSLAANLADKGIRVNAVAPGPIWTPLIPASFDPDKVEDFGKNAPLGRPGQPDEVAPSFIFLASDDAAYMSGQVLHPNGGESIGG